MGISVDNILRDDEANEEFRKINVDIAGVECEAKTPEVELLEAAVHIVYLQKNQYATLADYDKNYED